MDGEDDTTVAGACHGPLGECIVERQVRRIQSKQTQRL
jgi:hypothetical protein